MTTLDDLLALLPDNNTGEIDAVDLREIVTALWSRIDENETRIAALETTDGGLLAFTGIWQVNPGTGAVPAGPQVSSDSNDFSTATAMFFAKVDTRDRDMSTILSNAVTMYGQEQLDASNWARFDVSGPVVDHGTYLEVPVTVIASGGSSGSAAWQNAVFAIGVPA